MTALQSHLPGLFLIWGALAFGFVAPGPTMLAVMGTGLRRGRRPAFWVAGGCVFGSMVWAVLSGSALARLFPEGSTELFALRIAAAGYLLLIAATMLREARRHEHRQMPSLPGRGLALATGAAVISLTNLKGAIFWLAAAVVAVGPNASVAAIVALAIGSGVISAAGHGAYAVVFSSDTAYRLYEKWRRPVEVGLAMFFTGAAMLVLFGATQGV